MSLAGSDKTEQWGPGYSRNLLCYTTPWILAYCDARVVRRTAALLDNAYGPKFSFDEGTVASSYLAALVSSAFTNLIVLMIRTPLKQLLKWLLPKHSPGPQQEVLDTGFVHTSTVATGDASSNTIAPAKVRVDLDIVNSDPGYKGSAFMVTETAMCLL